MENVILNCLFVPVALFIGLFFLFVFSLIVRNSSNYDVARNLESSFTTARMTRNSELINLLYKIGKPDMNGSYSPEKMVLWNIYRQKDAEDAWLTDQEINIVIECEYGGY